MASSTTNKPKPTPPVWPAAAAAKYEPVRPLGSGGFGSVWLASSKRGGGDDDGDGTDANSDSDSQYVAIKLIGSGNKTSTTVEEAYARREVSILSELSHPRIVRLVDAFAPDDGSGRPEKDGDAGGLVVGGGAGAGGAPTCIALSYARGPTIEQLLNVGGALGVHLARRIAAQLVDAVSYLHGRAVIHRDIKPDNCIVSGALPSDDAVYSDGTEGEDAAKEGRWTLTLIDFGFARALHPSEIKVDVGLYKTVHDVKPDATSMREEGANPAMLPSLDAPLEDVGGGGGGKGEGGGKKKKNARGRNVEHLDKSVSKKVVRNLSALGNRSYAAPEMMKGVRKNETKNNNNNRRGRKDGGGDELGISRSNSGVGNGVDGSGQRRVGGRRRGNGLDGSSSSVRKSSRNKSSREQGSLAECVSDYGMIADAFSLGATIRYVLTGVPPQFAVDDFMAMRNNPVAVAGRAVGKLARKVTGSKKKKKKKGGKDERKRRYKGNDKIPKEAAQLVRALTHWDHSKRTTVRAARLYPWIYPAPYGCVAEDDEDTDQGGGGNDEKVGGSGMDSSHSKSGGTVDFLRCALDGHPDPAGAGADGAKKKKEQAAAAAAAQKGEETALVAAEGT